MPRFFRASSCLLIRFFIFVLYLSAKLQYSMIYISPFSVSINMIPSFFLNILFIFYNSSSSLLKFDFPCFISPSTHPRLVWSSIASEISYRVWLNSLYWIFCWLGERTLFKVKLLFSVYIVSLMTVWTNNIWISLTALFYYSIFSLYSLSFSLSFGLIWSYSALKWLTKS